MSATETTPAIIRFPDGAIIGPRPYLSTEDERLSAVSWSSFAATRIAPTIGAEISGIDLTHPDRLGDDVVAELRQALVDYKVLFFRDQRMDTRAHVEFASRFGELEEHPFLPAADGQAALVRFEKSAAEVGLENMWHSDVSWREIPSLGSVLPAVEIPEVGGDTVFADMYAAWDGLAPDLQDRLIDAIAIHDFTISFGALMTPEERAQQQVKFPPARHPVARTHPESGRRLLYVNRIFTSHLEGWDRDESDAMLEFLCREAHVPEYHCRFRWSPGAVAFWDNRAVQHYAVSDYWPRARVMERATIIGDRPR